MFSQIDDVAEIATCTYFFGFQRTDKGNRNYFSSIKHDASFPQEITRTSQTYRRQNQSACPACCAFLSHRVRLPWHAQKMCAVIIVGTVLKKIVTTMRWNCTSKVLCLFQITIKHQDSPFFTVFLTIKTSSQNISILLLQISLKLHEHWGGCWRKKVQ